MAATIPRSALRGRPKTDADDRTQRIVLDGVSWATYEALLADHGDRSVPRFAYDRGVLEIVRPTATHEERADALAAIVGVVAEERGIPHRSVRSMTYRRATERRGFEADASFYIQTLDRVRGKRQIDPESDPPPDLVIETDVTHSSLDKLDLYARLGVLEVWRDDAERIHILVLRPDGEGYDDIAASAALPILTAARLTGWLGDESLVLGERHRWLKQIRDWVRAQADTSG